MHDLEARMAAWRQSHASKMPGQDDMLKELEDHLREHTAELIRSGVAIDAAFELAVKRLGGPEAIAEEIHRLRPRWFGPSWPVRLVKVGAGITLVTLLGVCAWKYHSGRLDFLLFTHVVTVASGYFASFGSGVLGLCYLLISFFRTATEREVRDARQSIRNFTRVGVVLTTVGLILGMIWAREHWGRYWGWDPQEVGALFILSWAGFMMVALSRPQTGDRAIWKMAVLGNAVTLLGWHGANNLALGLPIPWMLLAIVASQVALTFIPRRREAAN